MNVKYLENKPKLKIIGHSTESVILQNNKIEYRVLILSRLLPMHITKLYLN